MRVGSCRVSGLCVQDSQLLSLMELIVFLEFVLLFHNKILKTPFIYIYFFSDKLLLVLESRSELSARLPVLFRINGLTQLHNSSLIHFCLVS